MSKEFAIVFVANDVVYEQTVAFLESIESNSPGLRLICIPYDDNMNNINILSEIYGFEIFDSFDFSAFMNISTIMIGRPLPRIRKLAAFEVPVDEFLSLDTDIIVLQDLTSLFGHTSKEVDIFHFDLSPGGTYWDNTSSLISHSKEIDTGAFISSNKIWNYDNHVKTIMSHYPEFKRIAIMENDDQPFGSFVFDIHGREYRSIESISSYSEHTWYKKDFVWADNTLVHRLDGRKVPLIHYAGVARGEGYASAERFKEIAVKYLLKGKGRVACYRN